MADTSTIASLATAAGTLVLALATFSSTRSANRAARVSERALQVGLRPLLFNARPQDPSQKVGFMDDHWLVLRNGLAAVQQFDENLYLAIPLRNVASGIAVLHGWHLWTGMERGEVPPPLSADSDEFRRLQRDLYVPAGDVNFWQAALRDRVDRLYVPLRQAIDERNPIGVDILYGDHEGGQRTITRFRLTPRAHDDEEPWLWMCSTSRHWNLDRADPR
ncbi:MAG TPA: hypothetical protein VIH92_11215 [Solirubrobacteraceae bacterium]|jgi:hypothetical protein